MKIEFKKVIRDNTKLSFKQNSLSIDGKCKKLTPSLVEVKLSMIGEIEIDCVRCANTIDLGIDENVELKVCDGYFESEDKDLDVIECFDGIIDFDQIVNSEIESIMSDYHYCNNCKQEGE